MNLSDITIEWFFKLPGLFITGGFLLILIALLILIIGRSRSKKQKVSDELENFDNGDNATSQTTVVEPITPIASPVASIENNTVVEPGSDLQPQTSTNNTIPSIEPISIQPIEVSQIAKPVDENNTTNNVETTNVEPITVQPAIINPIEIEPIIVKPNSTETQVNVSSNVNLEEPKEAEEVTIPVSSVTIETTNTNETENVEEII